MQKMPNWITIQLESCTFSEKDPVLVIAFFRELASSCDAFVFNESATMWLFKHFLTGRAEAVVKSLMTFSNAANVYQEGA